MNPRPPAPKAGALPGCATPRANRLRSPSAGVNGARTSSAPSVRGAGALDMPCGPAPVGLRPTMGDAERIRVFLLDDHEVVRRGLRDLLEAEDDIDGRRRGRDGGGGLGADPADPARRRRSSTCDCPTATASRCAARSARASPARVPDADVVLRRRSAVRGDHGRRGRLSAQAGQGHRPRRRRPPGRARASRCSTRRSPRACSNGSATPPGRTNVARLTDQERRILDLIAEASPTARSASGCSWPRRR